MSGFSERGVEVWCGGLTRGANALVNAVRGCVCVCVCVCVCIKVCLPEGRSRLR